MTYIGRVPKEEGIRLFHDHVSSGKVNVFTSYGMDFIFGKREGIYIWDVEGKKRLINCHSNGGVFNLGHRNPEIAKTLISAIDELDIGNHHLISEQRALLASKLAEFMPGDITYTIFGVSGGEAIDTAIKIARAYTRRPGIISAKGGYHGHTGFALFTGDEKYRKPFGPMPADFSQVPFNDISALKERINNQTAAVIFETIPATLGIYVPDKDYFKQVRDLCDKNGSLLIIDEVQTGFGRTGRLWGIEHFDVVPDIIVIGKGMSGGMYPMTATCIKEKLEVVFKEDPFIHVSTFGGAEIGCPVAMKVLEISTDPSFLRHVNEIASLFKQGLDRLKQKYPKLIVSIRQLGLMMGIKMVNEMCGPIMTKTCYENGILSIYANNDTSVSQLLPPLIITEQETEDVMDRLDKALEQTNALIN